MNFKSFKQFAEEEGGAPVNSTGPAVDMNPNGKKSLVIKMDRRSRWSTNKLYNRAKGTKQK